MKAERARAFVLEVADELEEVAASLSAVRAEVEAEDEDALARVQLAEVGLEVLAGVLRTAGEGLTGPESSALP